MSSNDNLSRLVALFDENVKTLTQLWEEIGVEQHERAESLRSLRDKLHNIVTDTTRVEKEKKSQLIAAIEDSRKRAQQAANALGIRFEQVFYR